MIEVVIPVRLDSSRLPDKFRRMIGDKTLLEHVYENASKAGFLTTIVADDPVFYDLLPDANISIVSNAKNGTERVAKYACIGNDDDIIVNCQGDLPFVTPMHILSAIVACHYADVGTIVAKMDPEKQNDPNTVKAICSHGSNNNAMQAHWFLRAPLHYGYHHLGVYAFKRKTLRHYCNFDQSKFEDIERLEQLRWLDMGKTIAAIEVADQLQEVNTLEDLQLIMEKHNA